MERLTVSVAEAAEMLGISRWQAYDLVNRGVIPSLKLGPRSTRVPVEALKRRIREMAGLDGEEEDQAG